MFVFNRSAAAVILPIALLVAVVLWSGRSRSGLEAANEASEGQVTTVASVEIAQPQGG
jgi:hypothetical protein